jgi:hypothetical protein
MEKRPVKLTVERSVRDRYAAHVVIPPGGEEDPSACWSWRGATHSTSGIGIMQVAKGRGGHWSANRIGWSLLHGPLLPWQVLIHEGGDNPTCSRGSHWRLVPHAKRRAGKAKRYSAKRRAELLAYAARMGVEDTARAFEVPLHLLERWARESQRREALNGGTPEGVRA